MKRLFIHGLILARGMLTNAATDASYQGRWLEGDGDPAMLEAVDALDLDTARWVAGGRVDRLSGRSVWQEPVAPEIPEIARAEGLIP